MTLALAPRLVFVGDELLTPLGDPRALGWVGRVLVRTPMPQPITSCVLAVPGETTTALAARWLDETRLRLAPAGGGPNHLVVGLGAHDILAGISLARSRLNLANLLDQAASAQLTPFVVGPPPIAPPPEAARLEELSAAFGEVAARREVPYVEVFRPLVRHEQWLADMAATAGAHPGQAGYGLIAWLVLHSGWLEWLATVA